MFQTPSFHSPSNKLFTYSSSNCSNIPQIDLSLHSLNGSLLNRAHREQHWKCVGRCKSHVLQAQNHHVHSIHADLAAIQVDANSNVLTTFSCWSTPFRIIRPLQQRFATACSVIRPSLCQTAQCFGLFLLATVADALEGDKAHRTAGDAGGQCHTLPGDRIEEETAQQAQKTISSLPYCSCVKKEGRRELAAAEMPICNGEPLKK